MINGIQIAIIIGVSGETYSSINPILPNERVTDIVEENRLTDDGDERITD
jgi:hypothetical protein